MEFENLEQLKTAFKGGQFPLPAEIFVNKIKYKSNGSSNHSLRDMVQKKYKGIWIYSTAYREEAKAAGLEQEIILLWGFVADTLNMVPYDVRTMTRARLSGPIIEKVDNNDDSITIAKDLIIGDVVDVVITSLAGTPPMKGKIDTGADISSLHADEWSIKDEQITFLCRDLSENRITMPLIEQQAIKLSNGSVEYRPVVEFNIKINNTQLTNCMFNLNDRGTMKYSMLVGQNVLEAGGFMVDPTINDGDEVAYEGTDVDWEGLQEEFKDDVVEQPLDEIKAGITNKIIGFLNEVK